MPNPQTHDPQDGGEMTEEQKVRERRPGAEVLESAGGHYYVTDNPTWGPPLTSSPQSTEQEAWQDAERNTRPTLSNGDAEPLTGTPLRWAVVRSKWPAAVPAMDGDTDQRYIMSGKPGDAPISTGYFTDEAVDAAALRVLAAAGYKFDENISGMWYWMAAHGIGPLVETLRLAQEDAMRDWLKRTASAVATEREAEPQAVSGEVAVCDECDGPIYLQPCCTHCGKDGRDEKISALEKQLDDFYNSKLWTRAVTAEQENADLKATLRDVIAGSYANPTYLEGLLRRVVDEFESRDFKSARRIIENDIDVMRLRRLKFAKADAALEGK